MLLQLHNDINEIPLLNEWIEQLCEAFSLPDSASFQLNLALEEAIVNVMTYAYPDQVGMPITLEAEKKGHEVVFTLSDYGIAFDPLSHDAPDLTLGAVDRPIGGLGIFLVKEMMSHVEYKRTSDQNILLMKYSIT